MARMARTISRMRGAGWDHSIETRLVMCGLIWLPRPRMNRPWEALGGLSNCSWSVLGEGVRGWRLLEHNAGSLPEPVLGDDD
jgi:probable phosphoglycerate mutase